MPGDGIEPTLGRTILVKNGGVCVWGEESAIGFTITGRLCRKHAESMHKGCGCVVVNFQSICERPAALFSHVGWLDSSNP